RGMRGSSGRTRKNLPRNTRIERMNAKKLAAECTDRTDERGSGRVRFFVCEALVGEHRISGGIEALAEYKLQLRDRVEPDARDISPLRTEIPQRQVQQLRRRLVSGKVAAGLDDLPQLHVDALDRVRRREQATNRHRVLKGRRDVLPAPL